MSFLAPAAASASVQMCRKQAVEVSKQRFDGQGADKLPANGFDVKTIHVYLTDPADKSCKSWTCVREIALAGVL